VFQPSGGRSGEAAGGDTDREPFVGVPTPRTGQAAAERPAFGPVTASRVGLRAGGGSTGSRGAEPQGREWPKHVTGLEEEQTVKVVKNGEGGPKRVWKPVTRRRPEARVRAPADGCGREVDSSGWERRRGGESHGRDVRGERTAVVSGS
jgi:hypothetical protein